MTPSYIDRYEILDRIGQGGMASVYLARDPAIGRLVAIKLLKEEFDDDLRERFAREARAVGQLEHVNIVTVYDVGDHAGRPFIAMSYIQGQTLAEIIRRREPLSMVRKLLVIEELCAGLHAAHKAGIVHRDIKPANVIVDREGVVKILDFGLARLTSEAVSRTQVGTVMGSYNYMSPEQISGQPLRHPSDVFAVGAIFYEVLSYTRAFPGLLADGLLNRIVREPPPPLRELCPGLDLELEPIVMRALEKEPGRRYQEIDVMRRDVARVRRRLLAAEVDRLVDVSEQASRRGDHEAALASAQAALALEPDDTRANGLLRHGREAVDERHVRTWLEEARSLHKAGNHRAALKMLLTRTANWSDELNREFTALRQDVEDAFTRQVLEAERSRLESKRAGDSPAQTVVVAPATASEARALYDKNPGATVKLPSPVVHSTAAQSRSTDDDSVSLEGATLVIERLPTPRSIHYKSPRTAIVIGLVIVALAILTLLTTAR